MILCTLFLQEMILHQVQQKPIGLRFTTFYNFMHNKQSKEKQNIHKQLLVLTNNFFIDFNLLAARNLELYPHLVLLDCKSTINFKNQASLICLTKCLLKQIFGIAWNCPMENLCPRIPNRINYLLWIHHYIIKLRELDSKVVDILDLGTGANCIYPLLGVKLFPNWNFIAIQTEQSSWAHASKLIQENSLQSRIKLVKSSETDSILCEVQGMEIDCVICNPPFFDSEEFYEPRGKMKPNQYETQGGEYQFFFELFRESLRYSTISLFTCLLGTKNGFKLAQQFLIEQRGITIQQCKFGQIRQGNNVRFIVAWETLKTV